MKKIVIVGGVAGGAGAAARLRRLSEEDRIIVLEKGPYMSFANCGLPYYIGEVITDREKLIVQKSDNFQKRFNAIIRENSECIEIDSKNKTVKVHNSTLNETYDESYDELIISTGASAVFPPIKGINDASNIFPLKTIPDTDNIYNYIKDNNVKNAIVVGGGFIGLEAAENLNHRGINTTLIDVADRVLGHTIDLEFANMLHFELEQKGVKLMLKELVSEIKNDGKLVVTKNGQEIKTDLIIMAAGVKPNTEIAINTGIKVDDKSKHIVVDDNFKTSVDNIYAVGDAVLVKSDLHGKNVSVPLAWPANRHARLVADVINGKEILNHSIYGASIIKVFNKTYASVGLTEYQAKELGKNYDVVYCNRGSHAGYYPGATAVVLKLIFDKDTYQIYGAAGIGGDGVDKRIDVIATAMRFNGKANELSSIELCYAPPFNSAKDPVNIIGYVAENVIDGVYKTVQWHEIDSIVKNGGYLLDVRTDAEFSLGHVNGAHNYELDELRYNISKLPEDKTKPLYVTCQVGHRAYLAIRILHNLGYTNLFNLVGGYGLYKQANYKGVK